MITRYFGTIKARFCPANPNSRPIRLFLQNVVTEKARMESNYKLTIERLPRSSQQPPVLTIVYKDKEQVEIDVSKHTFDSLVENIDAHSRRLALKDKIMG